MRPEQRRWLDRFLVLVAAVVAGVVALIGALVGDTERIGAYWMQADIDDTATVNVIEVIDYDFGVIARRGILRQIPDLPPTTDFSVESPTAPDDLLVQPWWLGSELRVGDPNQTVTGRHRYTIRYAHDGLVIGDDFAWNAVGDGWTVSAHEIEVHITSARTLSDLRCDTGETGDEGGCSIELVAPGHAVARHDEVSPGRFLTVRGTLGGPITAPVVAAPTGPAPDPGVGALAPFVWAAVAAVIGGFAVSALHRRAGREWVWDGGAVDAAFGPDELDDAPTRRVDHAELAEMTTIEFESPRGYSAAIGGVIHAERVKDDHKMAWLLEAAIRDEVELDTAGATPELRRGAAEANPAVERILKGMFGGSSVVRLDSYDSGFTAAWGELGTELEQWQADGGYWDRKGARRRRLAIALGIVATLLGGAVAFVAAGIANRNGAGALTAVAIGGLLAGIGLGSIIRAWELRIRTPQGSGAWILVESFRRFLHESEAEHVERAADMGLLRQYTAWAVALDETDRWERAVKAAASVPGSRVAGMSHQTAWIYAAPSIRSALGSTTTAPSSSGGGGGFSGGAGGGGGGGGGGSW
ncbi:MAG: DUF2207 domain-containing protein [Acidimicrobiales bacterium]|nr:DUF2207 domain-containing protein [Acidimicrobiales bacterium]